jgi:hypothetical protein
MTPYRVALTLTLVAAFAALPGCGFLGFGFGPEAQPQLASHADAAPYPGLANKSLAIVVYAPIATLDEFPGAREEISSFVATQIRGNMPTTALVDPRQVVSWQDSTFNWQNLSPSDFGKHFQVQRVLVIQILDYSTKRPLGVSNLQGRLRAQCLIFDTPKSAPDAPPETSLPAPVWSGLVDAAWPSGKPLDPTQTNENAVRLRTLESFSDLLVRFFYERREPQTTIRG